MSEGKNFKNEDEMEENVTSQLMEIPKEGLVVDCVLESNHKNEKF